MSNQREIKIRFNNRGTLQIWTLSQLLLEHKDLTRLKNPQLFTGRKDEKGKEIYEGDIVKITMGGFDDVEISPIEFKDGGFWPTNYDCECGWPELQYVEVIGNITENKGLLK